MAKSKIRLCVDLFSGLGCFSQAFFESDGWRVIRIDNDTQFKDVPNTHILDLMKVDYLTLNRLGATKPDILLMSPPCQCFSLMSVYRYWDNGRPKTKKTRDAISLVQRAISLKNSINPKFWVLENPNGMMIKVLGKPNHYTYWGSWYSERDPIMQKVDLPPMKPTSIWGILPDVIWRPKPKKGEYQEAKRGEKKGIQDMKLTPEERSCIPYEFSLELLNAIERNLIQETLV